MTWRTGLAALLSLLPLATPAREAPAQVFRRLDPAALGRLEAQRAFVAQLVARRLPGKKLTRTKADLAVLQRIVDARLVPKDETWQLQALGVAFGDVLVATIEGLAWWEVTDAFGTDPTLRYRESGLQVNALTMISKRVEEGRSVELADLAATIAEFVRTRHAEYE